MRFLSIFLPFLPTDRLIRARCAAREAPLTTSSFATWDKIGGAQKLVAVDAAAHEVGLRPGMALAAARAMRPDLVLHQAEPQAEALLLEQTADWLRRFTPLSAVDPPDGAMLDISGVAHLFGGEAAMIAEIERRLADQGFHARCAIAPNPALAWALARFSSTRILEDGDHAGAARVLRVLPVAALRISEDIVNGLRTAGLSRVGDLLTRPRSPLAARFGAGLIARLDAITGALRDPISPRFEAAPYMAERRFAEGLARREDIERILADLAQDLCEMLERHGEGARRIAASFFRVDGVVRHIEAGASRPLRDPVTLTRLLREKIEALGENGLDTGYGFDVMRLAATEVEGFRDAPQIEMQLQPRHYERSEAIQKSRLDFGFLRSAPRNDELNEAFADLLDRLGARFGLRRVLRLEFQDTHIPEFAVAALPASMSLEHPSRRALARAPQDEGVEQSHARTRPPRLFEKPEPIEAIASVPDGPPLRFRWRRVTHEIAAYEGPERIAPEWWRDAGLTRDYFRVEDRDGGRFWLFRDGLFGREATQPRWFVHGVFG
jgi:protein ImuB